MQCTNSCTKTDNLDLFMMFTTCPIFALLDSLRNSLCLNLATTTRLHNIVFCKAYNKNLEIFQYYYVP